MNKLYNSIALKRGNVIAIYTARHPSFVSSQVIKMLDYCFNDMLLIRLYKQVYSKPLIRKAREAAEPEVKKEAEPEVAKSEGGKSAEAKAEAEPEVVKSEGGKSAEAKAEAPKPQHPKQEGDSTITKQRVIPNDHFLIALSGLKIGKTNSDVNAITVTVNETSTTTPNHLEVNIKVGENNIGIQFYLSAGTWSAKYFKLGDIRYFSQVPVNAYDRKSFGCGFLRLSDGKEYIEFYDVQIQPLFNPEADEKLVKFSDTANDCVGFFSPAIWGALFVIIILVSILSCGITFIMDIKTMDRFDDPKGKTIIVNAQE